MTPRDHYAIGERVILPDCTTGLITKRVVIHDVIRWIVNGRQYRTSDLRPFPARATR